MEQSCVGGLERGLWIEGGEEEMGQFKWQFGNKQKMMMA